MLAYILAVLVGVSSTGLYLWAFFFPEIHRKQDFIWSGVGLFYALFLWIYAHQVTGGILIGQTASVALLGWFAWETFNLRRQLVTVDRLSTITPNATKRQNQREVNRAAPTVAKPTAKTPLSSPSPTASAPTTPPPTPVATTQTTPISSTPLAQLKVPPATADRAAPVASKAAPPTPTAPLANSTAKVDPSEPTILADSSSIEILPPTPVTKSSPVIASPQQTSPSTSQPIPAPAVNLSAEQEEAWIKLEVKPAPSKPLGTPAQPPTAANTAPTQSPAVVPEVINKNISTDPTETATELESENWA